VKSTPQLRICIVTHVVHYFHQGKYYALAPYVVEINSFPSNFKSLVVIAPFNQGLPPEDCFAYERDTQLLKTIEVGGHSFFSKLKLLSLVPLMALKIWQGFNRSDVIHVRCPGNMGLLGTILCWFTKKPRFAKYAGEWTPYKGESLSNRLQKGLLKSKGFGGPVLYYDYYRTSNIHRNLVPFYTSSLTLDQIIQANKVARKKVLSKPIKLLFAGRLSFNKGPDLLVKAFNKLEQRYPGKYRLVICGDGEQRIFVQDLVEKLKLNDIVRITGWIKFDQLFKELKSAHIICQPTRFTESWGKTLQEAMAYGAIPVASRIGGFQYQLRERPELLFEPNKIDEIVTIIEQLTASPGKFEEYRDWAIQQSNRYSLDNFRSDLGKLLTKMWDISIS